MSLFQKTSILLPLAVFLCLSVEGWASTTKLVNSVLVDSAVLERNTSIFVTMSNGTESILSMANSQAIQSDTENSSVLMRALEAHSESTQAAVVSVLKQLGVTYQSFWISNQIYIKDGSPSVISALLDALPRDSGIVSEIREEIFVPMMPTFNSTEGEKTLENAWGVDQIRAPAAWTLGAMGQNVIVAVIDSGHNPHADLEGKLVPGGFKDPLSGRTKPFDDSGHGTHVTGTILGANGVGVAPQARLVSCRACNARSCPQNALLKCAEFIGTKNARVVSCSWGAKVTSTRFFDSAIDFWSKEGIIPVFSVGNKGNKCNTVGYPGENDKVIAVGALDKQSTLADFSSRGPSTRYPVQGGTTNKPDVSAPGVAIKSSSHRNPAAHTELSGSSMAAPHVSGLIALMLSKNPRLTYDQIFTILKRNTERKVRTITSQTCGGTSDTTVPNNLFGYGEIRADKALNDRLLREVDTKEEINQN